MAVESLDLLSKYCRLVLFLGAEEESANEDSEFLVHAADVEGLCQGIDEELVTSTFITVMLSFGDATLTLGVQNSENG